MANQSEPQGFGLYSYLLFGSPPSDATRPAYVAVVKAALRKVEPIERKLAAGYAPPQLNVFNFLLYDYPDSTIPAAQLPDWIVDHYNYSRAQRLLGIVPASGTGIYILSVLAKPPDVTSTLKPPYLWEDLTGVDPTIVVAWVQYFLDQSLKDQPWESDTCQKLVLDLRNYIETIADQVHLTIPAMITAIKWFSPGS